MVQKFVNADLGEVKRMPMTIAKDEELPDICTAKEFYSRYEPKEILGRWLYSSCFQLVVYIQLSIKVV